jgi:hypothetical protein
MPDTIVPELAAGRRGEAYPFEVCVFDASHRLAAEGW